MSGAEAIFRVHTYRTVSQVVMTCYNFASLILRLPSADLGPFPRSNLVAFVLEEENRDGSSP